MEQSFPTGNAIFDAARAGDQSAFASLLAQYSPMIEKQLSRLRSLHPDLTDSDIEDLRQEAFLAFYRALLSFDPGQRDVSFGLFAKICIENALVSACRKIRPLAAPLDDETLETLPDDGTDDPTRHLRDEEAFEELYAVIERTLSPYENAIWRQYVAGQTAEKIASALGRNARSVHNAIYRIRCKLRAVIDPPDNRPVG